MATVTTILQLLLVWLAAYAMGLAVVKALVPADLEAEFGTLITPTVGYLVFCLCAFSASAAFGLAAATAAWIVMAVLATAGLATQLRPAWRIKPRVFGRDLRRCLVLMLPMAVLTLFPARSDLFGAYGIGLFIGFFLYFIVLLVLVGISKKFTVDWFLDGRRAIVGPDEMVGTETRPTTGAMIAQNKLQ